MPDQSAAPHLPLDWSGSAETRTGPEQTVGGPSAPPEPTAAPVGATGGEGGERPPMPEVEVRTSARRRKTATAYWEGGHIVVVLPARMPVRDRQEMVESLVRRVLAHRPHTRAGDEELLRRAEELAKRYVGQVRPCRVRWVTNQGKRWGSCSPATGDIRLSHRLRAVPRWVLDAVLVHELAHLLHADHSPAFHAVADRYPRQREAGIFLDGYALGLDGRSADGTDQLAGGAPPCGLETPSADGLVSAPG